MPFVLLGTAVARADDFSVQDRFCASLSSPMSSVVEGKPFRIALTGLAHQAGLNIWVDRRVDPSSPVSANLVGLTVYSAIEKLAAERDCVVMPVSRVVLVGRQGWVDQTANAILSLKLGAREEPADIAWDDLTTPAEAMVIAAGGAVDVEPTLPHDLWPATDWKQIDRRVAIALVLSQFDRVPQSTPSLTRIRSAPATNSGSVTRRYALAKANAVIRRTMQDRDRRSRFRQQQDWLEATGNVAAHREAVQAHFQRLKVAAVNPASDTFTLKKTKATAENLLMKFAQTAGKRCVIEETAREACKQVVSIEGTDLTLEKLVEMVADRVGVTVIWSADRIAVSRP